MLVLTRQPGERIAIGDDIVVIVAAVDGDQVRIGIEAPKALPVTRAELRSAPGQGLDRVLARP